MLEGNYHIFARFSSLYILQTYMLPMMRKKITQGKSLAQVKYRRSDT